MHLCFTDSDWDPDLESLWCGDPSTTRGHLPAASLPSPPSPLHDSSFERCAPLLTPHVWNLPYGNRLCLNLPTYGLASTPKSHTPNIMPCTVSMGNGSFFGHSFVLRGDIAGHSMNQSRRLSSQSGYSFSLDIDHSFKASEETVNVTPEGLPDSPSTSTMSVGVDSGIDITGNPSPVFRQQTQTDRQLSRRRAPVQRIALQTLNIEPKASSSKSVCSTSSSRPTKRKCSTQIGNQTKTHVPSC